jgi:hypothetical protein
MIPRMADARRRGAAALCAGPLRAAPASAPTVALALWRLFQAGAWDDARALLAPDVVVRWPQSGECFRGADDYLAVNRSHPAPGWELTVHRLVDGPGGSAVQVTLEHAEGVDHGACFYVVSRGRIVEGTELWAERTEAPAWRAEWNSPEPAACRAA